MSLVDLCQQNIKCNLVCGATPVWSRERSPSFCHRKTSCCDSYVNSLVLHYALNMQQLSGQLSSVDTAGEQQWTNCKLNSSTSVIMKHAIIPACARFDKVSEGLLFKSSVAFGLIFCCIREIFIQKKEYETQRLNANPSIKIIFLPAVPK